MTDEEPALAALRKALGDQQTRGGGAFRLIAIASVLGAAAVVAVGYMFVTGSDRSSKAVAAGERDTSVCEDLLATQTEADPKPLYFCSPSPGVIARMRGQREETQRIMANAVYKFDLDGVTHVAGLASPGARYGWNRKVCSALTAPLASGDAPLSAPPVDPASC
ncbi:MAG TPA: hypothetical protein VFE03_12420 [Caulobacteraceae bacterium]|nr:hypothetical protein [Caulobacteraceae bacterium]